MASDHKGTSDEVGAVQEPQTEKLKQWLRICTYGVIVHMTNAMRSYIASTKSKASRRSSIAITVYIPPGTGWGKNAMHHGDRLSP